MISFLRTFSATLLFLSCLHCTIAYPTNTKFHRSTQVQSYGTSSYGSRYSPKSYGGSTSSSASNSEDCQDSASDSGNDSSSTSMSDGSSQADNSGSSSNGTVSSGSSSGSVESSSEEAGFTCKSTIVKVPVTVNVTEFNAPPPTSNSQVIGFLVSLFSKNSQLVSQITVGPKMLNTEYDMATTLCVPKEGFKEDGTLIFGIHGVSYDSGYWNFDSPNSKFNFVNSATKNGHAVFIYDRLGTGKSSKPDGTQEVQASTQVEIAHQLVKQIREDGITGLKFGKLVAIGHSFGSIQIAGVTALYPNDFDHVVLTALTLFGDSLPLSVTGLNLGIAAQRNEQLFGQLPGDYVIQSDQFSHEYAFFKFGGFDDRISALSQEQAQTATVGEVLTLTAPLASPAVDFKGKVLSVIGADDIIFCPGDCSVPAANSTQTIVENLATFFPSSAKFDSFVANKTGHAVQLHNSISDSDPVIQNFINSL